MHRVRFPLLPYHLRWLAAFAVATTLVYFSLVPPPPSGPSGPPVGADIDKQLHLAGYAILGLSLIYATASSRLDGPTRVVFTLGAAVLLGVTIELLQGPLPDRYFSYADVLANGIGVLLAGAWFLVESRLEYVRIPP